MKFCELCEKQTKKWFFPCRDPETGRMAEVEIVCKECHDELCMCDCPRKKTDSGNVKLQEVK